MSKESLQNTNNANSYVKTHRQVVLLVYEVINQFDFMSEFVDSNLSKTIFKVLISEDYVNLSYTLTAKFNNKSTLKFSTVNYTKQIMDHVYYVLCNKINLYSIEYFVEKSLEYDASNRVNPI